MDDRGTIKVSTEPEIDDTPELDMGDDLTADLAQPDMSAEPAPDTDEEMDEPVSDVNVTDKMAKRALKRRIG
jgi:hypothetical protein